MEHMDRRHYKRRMHVLVIFSLIFYLFGSVKASASSGSITFSTKTPKVVIGDTFSVTVSIKSAALIRDCKADISYNKKLIKFVSGSRYISMKDGVLHISEVGQDKFSRNKKYTIKFKAIKSGTSEIDLSGKPSIYAVKDKEKMSVSVNRLTVKIKKSRALSKNTKLKSLEVDNGKLSPRFNSNVKEYRMTVKSAINKVAVFGKPKDEDATVTVSGNEELKEGNNTITVKVTAPSGDKDSYTIMVKKKGDSQTNANTRFAPDSHDGGFKVMRQDNDIVIKNVSEYRLVDTGEDTVAPPGYEKTTLVLNDISITTYTLQDDLENDFLLMYCKNKKGEKAFYQYDRVEKTLQRYNPKNLKMQNKATIFPKQKTKEEKSGEKITQLAIIIALLCVLCAFLTIALICMFFKVRGYNDDNDDNGDDNDDDLD